MDTPEARVAEFVRQWELARDKEPLIYTIWFDDNASPAELNVNDLHEILAKLPGTEREVRG